MKKIKVTIHKDGTQHVEVLNGAGEDCTEFTSVLEGRLGKQEGERVLKPEYYEEEHVVETDREIEGA